MCLWIKFLLFTLVSVTIVTDPPGIPVDGQPGTFDYPILTSVTLMCMATLSNGSPVTVTSYRWTATECYTRSGGVQDPCFYGDYNPYNPIYTGQNITDDVLAQDAGTVRCTATIGGVDYTSDPLTLRISGEGFKCLVFAWYIAALSKFLINITV